MKIWRLSSTACLTLAALLVTNLPSFSPAAAAETLKLDEKASKITFVGTKPDGKHEGGFKSFEVTAVADAEQAENSKLEIVIDAGSLWSDDPKLTNHLKNPDFFDVRKHSKITFASSQIEEGDEEGTIVISGKMKMLDKEVEVKIPAKVEMTETMIKLDADFKIDRTKWGMTYGEGRIDKDVSIKATLTFSR
jgi:polyisoprenoid-binding protein YceI